MRSGCLGIPSTSHMAALPPLAHSLTQGVRANGWRHGVCPEQTIAPHVANLSVQQLQHGREPSHCRTAFFVRDAGLSSCPVVCVQGRRSIL